MKSKIYELKKSNSICVSKKTILLLLLLAFTFACSNNDDENTPNTNPISQLPPATQIGANKVGCLLDGEVFIPGNGPLSTNCFYQFVSDKHYFYLSFQNYISDDLVSIVLKTEGKQIFQEKHMIYLKILMEMRVEITCLI